MILTPLYFIAIPASANIVFREIMQIAAFDVYDTTDGILNLFQIEETEPIDYKFEAMGFESKYCLANMGTLAIFFGVYVCELLLTLTLKPIQRSKRHKKLRKCSRRIERRTMWGSFITIVNESY